MCDVRDCPNDINEAVSTLIFASARFGDLPELLTVRKLFGERYGHRFANVALKLLPGNLVNRQIQEKLCIKCVPDDVKAKLLVGISRNALKSGPLLLEYSSEQQQQQHLGNESIVDPIEPSDDGRGNEVQDPQAPNIAEAEREVVYVDLPSGNSKNFLKDLCPSFLSSKAIFPSKCSAIVKQDSANAFESLLQKKFETITGPVLKIKPCETTLYGLQMIEQKEPDHDSVLTNEERSAAVESSSESIEKLPEETVCLDDIQEFQSPLRKGGSIQDQRLFMFRPSVLPMREKIDNANDQDLEEEAEEEEQESPHEKAALRSFRMNRKVSGKRLRRRSLSIDITGIKDIECAIYYGESYDISHDSRKDNHKKISIKQHQKSCHHPQGSLNSPNFVKFSSSFSFANSREGHKRSRIRCRLEDPYYLCSCDETDDCQCFPTVSKIECNCNRNLYIQKKEGMVLPNTMGSNPWTSSKESKHDYDYSRAMTMPTERPNENRISIRDNVPRSNSFPVQEPERCSSNKQHVHPKLPDYDELAAKFMALKKASLNTVK